MEDKTIERIASDLNIYRYIDEPLFQFECRMIYSATASWIKAITMDQPIGSKDEGLSGVSRRHLYERSRAVLETMCKMYPETYEWFFCGKEHPVAIIRTRLINRGDLLNEGFDTNVALSAFRTLQLTQEIEAVYGIVIDKNTQYSGISTIRHIKNDIMEEKVDDLRIWFSKFLKEAWWSSSFPDTASWQYFNPQFHTANNYSAWQDIIPKEVDGIVFARTVVNKNSYEYYLIKNKERLIHKIDPFLQLLGYHRRIMYVLRSKVQNNAIGTITYYDDHIQVHFNTHLPLAESGMFESYAWPVKNIEDKLDWLMEKCVWDYIEPHILALGIRIEEKQNG